MNDVILEVSDLKKHFELIRGRGQGRAVLKAVDGVSFHVKKGEVLGIVGESGCGKSTLGKTLIRLHDKTAGKVRYKDMDVFKLSHKDLTEARAGMQMIFQDPFSSLNPRKRVSSLIGQALRIHRRGTKEVRDKMVIEIMEEVGLNPLYRHRFPHQFSGGQRQRIGIARALALRPDFVVCDEAVSALDISIQAQILNLLLDLQERHGFTSIFISHDLAVVEFISTRIIVMYLGRIVESADKKTLVEDHVHPYTKALFQAFPSADPSERHLKKAVLMGDVPSPVNPPGGCHFHPRCPYALEECGKEYPPLKEISPGHTVACWLQDRPDASALQTKKSDFVRTP